MDVLDQSSAYQYQVLRWATSSPLLLHAICALSAKQMSLIDNDFLWDPVSANHYGHSLGLLIEELTSPKHDRGIVLSATILLCSFELLALPGMDYERHLYGARTLIEARDIPTDGSNLEHASFWVFARHDVSLALVCGRPTLIAPSEWPAVPQSKELNEDDNAKQILWLLAKVIAFKFSHVTSDCSEPHVSGIQSLILDIDNWWDTIPSHTRGIFTRGLLDHEVAQIWFSSPSAGKTSESMFPFKC
jgi:hypothetical protein